MTIDYERMKRTGPKHKAALTRAKKHGYFTVLAACRAAVTEWNEIGCWPDHWQNWNIALGDAASKHAREHGQMPSVIHLDQI